MAIKTRRILILGVIFWVLFAGQSFSQQKGFDLTIKMQRMSDLSTDFIALADPLNPESDRCFRLAAVAGETHTSLAWVGTLNLVFSKISNQDDRNEALPIIKGVIKYNSEMVGKKIETINGILKFTKSPAVATTGPRLKEELREIQKIFDSMN